jgi:gliding motility-associated protein GldM
MDNKEKVANYMILEKHGEELKNKLSAFRDKMTVFAEGNPQLQEGLAQIFNTQDVVNKDGVPEAWEKNRFEHYPLIAVLTFLTNMQADVRNAEASTIDYLQANIGKADLKFTGVKAVVMPKSNFVTQGDFYEAEVFLAAYDDTQDPEIIINNQALSAENIVNGVGTYKVKTSGTGEVKWGGWIKLRQGGELKEYKLPDMSYNVAPPSVVISPSKLNVLYRNVDNPLEIGVPGVDPARIRVSGPGISKVGSGWSADVTSIQGKEMTITVQVVDEAGQVKQTQSKMFRIKGLPQAEGSILKRSTGSLSASSIKNATIEAAYPDFPYDLSLDVVSFEIKIEGFPPAKISGNKIDGTNKARIDALKPGQSVSIRNIVAKTQRGDRISNIGAISIDVN